MAKEGNTRAKDYASPILFMIAVALVFVFLILSITIQKSNIPSIKNGATTEEIEAYAYELLESRGDDELSNLGYTEATAYLASQVGAATDAEQKFNLELDLAIFYGETGDPGAGLRVLGEKDYSSLPLDALYYLYTTYIYLYDRSGDTEMVAEYRQKIVDEGIIDYIAGLDDGTIVPSTGDDSEPADDTDEVNEEAPSEAEETE